MAVSLATFRTRYPEFSRAPDELVERKLEDAEQIVDRDIYGDEKADVAVLTYAAHLVASSPYGQHARLATRDGRSVYLRNYEKLSRTVGLGVMVV